MRNCLDSVWLRRKPCQLRRVRCRCLNRATQRL